MLNQIKRKQFETLLHMIFVLFCDSCDTPNESKAIHVMLETMNLAEGFGAEEGEILAINHNAHCYVFNQSKVDVDQFNEDYKLNSILHDIEI